MHRFLSGALLSLALAATAHAQSPWDIISLTDSYCTGSGGNFTGMGCDDAGGGNGSAREQALAALEREWQESLALAQGQADGFQAAYYAWLERYTPEDMSALPAIRRPDLPNADHPDMIDAYLCLRSNLASLALAADAPDLFDDAANLYRSHLAGYAGAHTRMAYYHLSQIFVTAYPEAGPLSLESTDHAALVRGILAAEIGSVGFIASVRAAGFEATWQVGDAHFDALLYHIGFHPGTYEEYDSLLAGLNCRAPLASGLIPASARTIAFARTQEERPDWEAFTLLDLLPPEDMTAFGFADDADAVVALLRDTDGRPSQRLTQVDFTSPAVLAYRERQRSVAGMIRFVELRPGDPRPAYAEMHGFGFPVGTTIFVPSLEALTRQPDREVIGLMVAAWRMRGAVTDYVSRYDQDRAGLIEMFTTDVERECIASDCR